VRTSRLTTTTSKPKTTQKSTITTIPYSPLDIVTTLRPKIIPKLRNITEGAYPW